MNRLENTRKKLFGENMKINVEIKKSLSFEDPEKAVMAAAIFVRNWRHKHQIKKCKI